MYSDLFFLTLFCPFFQVKSVSKYQSLALKSVHGSALPIDTKAVIRLLPTFPASSLKVLPVAWPSSGIVPATLNCPVLPPCPLLCLWQVFIFATGDPSWYFSTWILVIFFFYEIFNEVLWGSPKAKLKGGSMSFAFNLYWVLSSSEDMRGTGDKQIKWIKDRMIITE